MNCDTCKTTETTPVSVPFYSVEGERYYVKKYVTTLIVCMTVIICLVLGVVAFCYKVNRDCLDKVESMNKYWIDYISQYDFESYTYQQDGTGLNIIGDRNGVDFNVPTTDSTP